MFCVADPNIDYDRLDTTGEIQPETYEGLERVPSGRLLRMTGGLDSSGLFDDVPTHNAFDDMPRVVSSRPARPATTTKETDQDGSIMTDEFMVFGLHVDPIRSDSKESTRPIGSNGGHPVHSALFDNMPNVFDDMAPARQQARTRQAKRKGGKEGGARPSSKDDPLSDGSVLSEKFMVFGLHIEPMRESNAGDRPSTTAEGHNPFLDPEVGHFCMPDLPGFCEANLCVFHSSAAKRFNTQVQGSVMNVREQ